MEWMRKRMGWDQPTPAEAAETIQFRAMVNIATYNVQIFSPPGTEGILREADKRVLADLPAMLEHVEEELSKHLPKGYEARITEWSR